MSVPEPSAAPIEMNRLRGALRLCFAAKQADVLAALARLDAAEPQRALAPVVRAARLSYGLRRVVAPVVGRHSSAPLRPRLGLDTDAVLMLALHVGLDCGSELLAPLFGRTIDGVGAGLAQARQALATERVETCLAFRPLLGRYRELGAEREAQIALLQHVSQCPDCRRALELARQTDAELRETSEAFAGTLSPLDATPRGPRRLLASPLLSIAGMVLIGLLLLGGVVVGANRVLRPAHHATPLAAASAVSQPAGWLLEADETGKVDAVELSTGERRLLIPGVSGTRVDDLVSSDRRTIAQTIYLQYPKQPESLRIYDLDGTLRQRWDLETAQYVRTPIAWIDNARLLMTQVPVAAFEPTLNVFTHNVRQNSSLVVLDVGSGAEQSISAEGVHLARSSPDGTLLAIERYGADATGDLEIRPFDGKTLGPAIATVQDQPDSFWWSPDSGRLFAVVRDANGRFVLDAIDRSGQERTLVPFGEHDIVKLLGIAPDGQTLVYADASDSAGNNPWAFWQVDAASGGVRKLADGQAGQLSAAQAVWSPKGDRLVLITAEPYYLAAGTPDALTSYVTLAFDRQGNELGPVLDDLRANTALGWLPDGDIPATLPVQSATSSQNGASSALAAANLTIDAFSQVSPDGSRVLLHGRALSAYVAQPLNGGEPQTLGIMNDPSWLPDGSDIIGINTDDYENRIMLTTGSADPLLLDPAGLSAPDEVYRLPLIAPNGLRYSFFVVRSEAVQLWVGGRDQTARMVASWDVPNGVSVDPALVARWSGNDDLIFLAPDDWRDGLPRRSSLRRWSASSGTVDTLLNWTPRGNERGILGQELSLSRDGREFAIRLRHFTGEDVEHDRADSIVVASARDVSQAFEITRDAPGDGLSWSPDGTELAAGLRNKIAVLAADGRTIEYPPLDSPLAAEPLWLQPDEIWFATNDGSSPVIRRLLR
jgi:WD40 repeat protein